MKWGNNKFASSPFQHSLLTRVFPISRLCNLKSKDRSAKTKQKNPGMDFASQNSSLDSTWTEGRFYCADNDDCWRLSFRKDRDEARRSTGDINSLSRDFDEFKLGQVRGSSFNSLEWEEMEMARSERNKKFRDMDNKKTKETKQNRGLNKLSPRTECKIQAFEDYKKNIMKTKKEKQDKPVDGSTVFDSFAVVKSSFDPQQDFRDSMIQMIAEKGIRQQDELEELLACYLTLNCNKYHDLIIKVFRQVWFELKCQTT